ETHAHKCKQAKIQKSIIFETLTLRSWKLCHAQINLRHAYNPGQLSRIFSTSTSSFLCLSFFSFLFYFIFWRKKIGSIIGSWVGLKLNIQALGLRISSGNWAVLFFCAIGFGSKSHLGYLQFL
ncbi:unnamed protein product, partial [Prunus brigantina]